MRKNIRKRATIIILVAALLVGATGAIIWKLGKPSNDATDSFMLLSEGFTNRKVMDEASALAAIDDVAGALGLEDVNQELEVDQVNNVLGHTYYKFQQMHMGLPVYGKSIVVAADECGQALMLSGNIAAVTEGVPVKPTVTSEEIIDSVESYVLEHFSCPARSQISVAPFDADELTIFPVNDSFVLSYVIPVCFNSAQTPGYYELVVSAESGSVLYACPMLYEEVGYMASDIERKSGFPIVKADDGYYLWDAEDQFFVFDLNHQESKYDLHNIWGQVLKDENQDPYTISQWFKGEFVLSDNEIFGDTPAEQEKDFEAGARLLLNVKAASSFFKELGFSNDTRVFLYYRDGYDGGNNALGGMLNSHIGVISMGANTGVDCIDAICHEFTHFVSRSIVTWSGSNETSSISEGLSDIFGEIMEAQIKGQEIDWLMHDTRSIASPGENYITDYMDYTDKLDCHYASTLVSHAAYLMWKGIDGSDAFEPLSTEELANLFYETLYTLPSDCTFSQFRSLVQNTAEYQNLSTKQQLCISNAFFQVGITSAAIPVVKDHLSVDIYGINGLPYDDYTLHVRHNKAENTYDGETVKAKGITFPESGEYQLCVVDNANTDNQTTVTVLAVEHGGAKVIPIFTECGVSKPDGLIWTDTELPLETDTANIDIINGAESALQDFTLTENGSLTNISSERGSESTTSWSTTYNVVGYKSDSLIVSSEISVTDITSGVNNYTNEPYSNSRNYLYSKHYKDGILSCDISSLSSLPFIDTEMSPIDFMNLYLPDSECISDIIKKDSDGNGNTVFTIILQADAITSTNANILGHLIDSLSGMQCYINWTEDPEYGVDGGFDEISMTVTLDHDNRLKSIVIDSIVNVVIQDFFKAKCTLEYNFNYDDYHLPQSSSQQQLHDTLIKYTSSDLNVRELPQHDSKLVGKIDNFYTKLYFYGETKEGIGSDGEKHTWYKIRSDSNITGWVRSDLVISQDANVMYPYVSDNEGADYWKYTDRVLEVQSEPTYNSKLVGKVTDCNTYIHSCYTDLGLVKGVDSDGQLYEWTKVVVNSELQGWVRYDLLVEVSSAAWVDDIFIKNSTVPLNMRAQPQHDSELITSIENADTKMYYWGVSEWGLGSDGIMHEWYQVDVSSTERGWVRSDLVKSVLY